MAAVNTKETLKELSIEISLVRMELIKQNLVIISFKKHKLGSALGDPFKHSLDLFSKLYFQLNKTYHNIPRTAVAAVISSCTTCCLKAVQTKKTPLKPIIASGFLKRIQVKLLFFLFFFIRMAGILQTGKVLF